ncbi:MAG: lysophospholipid acyltransferase family protein [Candidatus Nitrohelix vancouverensis]|uniref:Lysophospholipid acyltransferase family protein n=1 Tax=Candidatus Nitrohelix vancouverensis TaxID=2705534 RepID=A0A7T0G209_9BACT|nr:MAG: lysophospholipid acyltransferase family protein [Candidatus Nitrohelix vancouverensis]
MKKLLIEKCLPRLVHYSTYLWCWLLRLENLDPEAEAEVDRRKGPCILTLWHGRIFYLFYHLRRRPEYHLLISPSKDGDFLARLALLMGYSVVRGSSYKKTISGTRSLIKILKNGGRIIIIADGSRGPCAVAQPGSIQLAGITQSPVIPMSYGTTRKKVFSSWDRFVLPLPFATCKVKFGSPISVPKRPDEHILKEKQEELQNSLDNLTRQSDA